MSEEKDTRIVRSEPQRSGLALHGMPEYWQFAKAAATAGWGGVQSAEQALMIMARGAELGLSPSSSLLVIRMILGRPSLDARGKRAVVKGRPQICEYLEEVSADDTQATYKTKRVGEPEQRETFTLEEARRAGLVKADSNWVKYPKAMLRARASATLIDRVYEDVLLGIATTEVLQDLDEEKPAPSVSDPGIGALVARFAAATTREQIQELASEVKKLGIKNGSFDHRKLTMAYQAAVARVQMPVDPEPPIDPGNGPIGPSPEPPAPGVPSEVIDVEGEYLASPGAWSGRLARAANEFEVIRAFLKRADAFIAAGVLDDRWQATAQALLDRGVADPAAFAEAENHKRATKKEAA
jgi:hypothetical protein